MLHGQDALRRVSRLIQEIEPKVFDVNILTEDGFLISLSKRNLGQPPERADKAPEQPKTIGGAF